MYLHDTPIMLTYQASIYKTQDDDNESTRAERLIQLNAKLNGYTKAELDEPYININIPQEAAYDINEIGYYLRINTTDADGEQDTKQLFIDPAEIFDAAKIEQIQKEAQAIIDYTWPDDEEEL